MFEMPSQALAKTSLKLYIIHGHSFLFFQDSDRNIGSEALQQAQDVLNLLAGFTVNLTDLPQLAAECGKVGLIPVFLQMAESLKDSIPDMIPFEVSTHVCVSPVHVNSLKKCT